MEEASASSAAPGPEVAPSGPPPAPSPLSGGYLLIILGEPHCDEHKDIILQRLAKGFLSWDTDVCHVDLEKELIHLAAQKPDGEESKNGERLIQFASESLVTEVLIQPQTTTLIQCARNLLSSFTRHRHIIHAGYTFAGNGSWALQDGTFSLLDFLDALREPEPQRVIRAYENNVSIDIQCSAEGEWSTAKISKEPGTKGCIVRVNPDDKMTAGSPGITQFVEYISKFLTPAGIEELLEPSDVVGNIRFSHPTLYVFPGGQGDAALFGINGFNMLVDGGYSRKSCFWDFTRHLDRLDAVMVTRINNSNIGGIASVLKRKTLGYVYPQIGHFFCNMLERRSLPSPDGDKDRDPLLLDLLEEGHSLISNLRTLELKPHPCYRESVIDPINLYHKVGHGKLDMYVLSPAKDSKEVKEFLAKWSTNDQKLFTSRTSKLDFQFPLYNQTSICALLVWQPANPTDTITRILFPGSTPQHKIFEGLEKIKHLEFLKYPTCTAKSMAVTTTKTKSKILEKPVIESKSRKILQQIEKPIPAESKSKQLEAEKNIKNHLAAQKSDKRSVGKSEDKKDSPPTPKKTAEGKPRVEKIKRAKSPTPTPAKSDKEANNRKVLESKIERTKAPAVKSASKRDPPKEVKTVAEKKAPIKKIKPPTAAKPSPPVSPKKQLKPKSSPKKIIKKDVKTSVKKIERVKTKESNTSAVSEKPTETKVSKEVVATHHVEIEAADDVLTATIVKDSEAIDDAQAETAETEVPSGLESQAEDVTEEDILSEKQGDAEEKVSETDGDVDTQIDEELITDDGENKHIRDEEESEKERAKKDAETAETDKNEYDNVEESTEKEEKPEEEIEVEVEAQIEVHEEIQATPEDQSADEEKETEVEEVIEIEEEKSNELGMEPKAEEKVHKTEDTKTNAAEAASAEEKPMQIDEDEQIQNKEIVSESIANAVEQLDAQQVILDTKESELKEVPGIEVSKVTATYGTENADEAVTDQEVGDSEILGNETEQKVSSDVLEENVDFPDEGKKDLTFVETGKKSSPPDDVSVEKQTQPENIDHSEPAEETTSDKKDYAEELCNVVQTFEIQANSENIEREGNKISEETKQKIEGEVKEIITSAQSKIAEDDAVMDKMNDSDIHQSSPDKDVIALDGQADTSTDKQKEESPQEDKKEIKPEEGTTTKSHPDEKLSAMETSATTAPSMPEDEKIDDKIILDEIKEEKLEIERAEIADQKEIAAPIIEPLKAIKLEQAQLQHHRDLVKTPDEVADLPMHEEVDALMYESVDDKKLVQEENKTVQNVDASPKISPELIEEVQIKKTDMGNLPQTDIAGKSVECVDKTLRGESGEGDGEEETLDLDVKKEIIGEKEMQKSCLDEKEVDTSLEETKDKLKTSEEQTEECRPTELAIKEEVDAVPVGEYHKIDEGIVEDEKKDAEKKASIEMEKTSGVVKGSELPFQTVDECAVDASVSAQIGIEMSEFEKVIDEEYGIKIEQDFQEKKPAVLKEAFHADEKEKESPKSDKEDSSNNEKRDEMEQGKNIDEESRNRDAFIADIDEIGSEAVGRRLSQSAEVTSTQEKHVLNDCGEIKKTVDETKGIEEEISSKPELASPSRSPGVDAISDQHTSLPQSPQPEIIHERDEKTPSPVKAASPCLETKEPSDTPTTIVPNIDFEKSRTSSPKLTASRPQSAEPESKELLSSQVTDPPKQASKESSRPESTEPSFDPTGHTESVKASSINDFTIEQATKLDSATPQLETTTDSVISVKPNKIDDHDSSQPTGGAIEPERAESVELLKSSNEQSRPESSEPAKIEQSNIGVEASDHKSIERTHPSRPGSTDLQNAAVVQKEESRPPSKEPIEDNINESSLTKSPAPVLVQLKDGSRSESPQSLMLSGEQKKSDSVVSKDTSRPESAAEPAIKEVTQGEKALKSDEHSRPQTAEGERIDTKKSSPDPQEADDIIKEILDSEVKLALLTEKIHDEKLLPDGTILDDRIKELAKSPSPEPELRDIEFAKDEKSPSPAPSISEAKALLNGKPLSGSPSPVPPVDTVEKLLLEDVPTEDDIKKEIKETSDTEVKQDHHDLKLSQVEEKVITSIENFSKEKSVSPETLLKQSIPVNEEVKSPAVQEVKEVEKTDGPEAEKEAAYKSKSPSPQPSSPGTTLIDVESGTPVSKQSVSVDEEMDTQPSTLPCRQTELEKDAPSDRTDTDATVIGKSSPEQIDVNKSSLLDETSGKSNVPSPTLSPSPSVNAEPKPCSPELKEESKSPSLQDEKSPSPVPSLKEEQTSQSPAPSLKEETKSPSPSSKADSKSPSPAPPMKDEPISPSKAPLLIEEVRSSSTSHKEEPKSPSPAPSLKEEFHSPSPAPSLKEDVQKSPSPAPSLKEEVQKSPSPAPSLKDELLKSPSPTPSSKEEVQKSPSPAPSLKEEVQKSPSPAPSLKEEVPKSPSPAPSLKDELQKSPSPAPSLKEEVQKSPSPAPSLKEEVQKSPSPAPSLKDELQKSPSPAPSLKEEVQKSPSPAPSLKEEVQKSPSPAPSLKDELQKSPSPTPSLKDELLKSPSPTPSSKEEVQKSPSPALSLKEVQTSPSPAPSEKDEVQKSPSPAPSLKEEVPKSPSPAPSLKEEVQKSPSPAPSLKDELQKSPSPAPSQKEEMQKSPSPAPSLMDEVQKSPSLAPSLKEEMQKSTMPAPSSKEEVQKSPVPSSKEEVQKSPSPTLSLKEEPKSPSPARISKEEMQKSPSPASSLKEEETKSPSPAPSSKEEVPKSPSPASSLKEEEVQKSPSPVPSSKEEVQSPSPVPSSKEEVQKSPSPVSSSKEEVQKSPSPAPSLKGEEQKSPSPVPSLKESPSPIPGKVSIESLEQYKTEGQVKVSDKSIEIQNQSKTPAALQSAEKTPSPSEVSDPITASYIEIINKLQKDSSESGVSKPTIAQIEDPMTRSTLFDEEIDSNEVPDFASSSVGSDNLVGLTDQDKATKKSHHRLMLTASSEDGGGETEFDTAPLLLKEKEEKSSTDSSLQEKAAISRSPVLSTEKTVTSTGVTVDKFSAPEPTQVERENQIELDHSTIFVAAKGDIDSVISSSKIHESDSFGIAERVSSPAYDSDHDNVPPSPHSDISSGQMSRDPHVWDDNRSSSRQSEISDKDIASPPFTSSKLKFEVVPSSVMTGSFYGGLPGDEDFAPTEAVAKDVKDTKNQIAKMGDIAAATAGAVAETLPAAGPSVVSAVKLDEKSAAAQKDKDPIESWGKPLGLPSPAPPATNDTIGSQHGTPKKEKPISASKRVIDRSKAKSNKDAVGKNKIPTSPMYFDLTYVPHHGNSNYSQVEFFKNVRARYYVFSGIEPSKEVYDALLEGKQSWDEKDLEVTIIPTYDTDTLGQWVAENEESIALNKIDLSPSASRCTINLQDHETSCSAYRLEF
ncbi:microtubule-associated protein futsch [Neocloeon triangulifer]|uniref:microtubule-associated protein futsch n=1 Tax=Neocloeon triangulifer TaxID=2078957 RepID=UPI00286F68C1|nr:microtubule-associated protein futsch [Neocloeon triangulifer]